MVWGTLNSIGDRSAFRRGLARCVLAVLAVGFGCALAADIAQWTVHADAGTPVLDAPLTMRPPGPLRGSSTHGFHPVVHVHAPADAWDGLADLGRYPRESVRDYHVVPLFGGMVAVGEYYAKVHIGGQLVRVQIDTGSATLAVPMAECQTCLAGDKRYNIALSTKSRGRKIDCEDDICSPERCSPFSCGSCSSKNGCCAKSDPKQCAFHLNFGDGSGAKGVLVKDFMTWGGVSFPTVFGGIENDSPDFERAQVDGILGMAYSALACNPSCVEPAFDAMIKYLHMKPIFQICINYDAGRIVLGDYDTSLGKEEPVWVPMALADPPSYYTVKIVGDLQLNGNPVPLPQLKLGIVDSGTTLIVFSSTSFSLLVDHLQTNFCDVPGLCSSPSWFQPAHCTLIGEKDLRKMPTMRFQLEGFDIVLGPKDYLINYASKGPDYWCVGIMQLASLSGGIDVIFGNTVMKKYVTIFDRDRKRIGFAESRGTCKSVKTGRATPSHVPGQVNTSSAGQPSGVDPNQAKSNNENAAGSGAPDKKAGEDPGSNVFANSVLCGSATSCRSCSNMPNKDCNWDISSQQCKLGDPVRYTCIVDFFEGKVAYAVGAGIGLVVLIVCIIVVAVCALRKRQNSIAEAAVDPDEATESRVPLAPGQQEDRRWLRNPTEASADEPQT
jgi:hypothetical protein